jgi:hypothetical protein
VLDQRGARVSVVADAVSAHPGVEHGEREEEKHKEKALRFAWTWLWRRGQTCRLPIRRIGETRVRGVRTEETRRAPANHEQNKFCPKDFFVLLRANSV